MSTTESQLRDEMSKFDVDGGLQQVHLVKRGRFDSTRTINCFLTYSTKAKVDRAVDLLQGQMLGGLRKYPAEVDQAYPRLQGDTLTLLQEFVQRNLALQLFLVKFHRFSNVVEIDDSITCSAL